MPIKSWIATPPPCWDWLDNLTRSGKGRNQTPADAQPGSQFLGGVGRLEHGWDGFVHLFPRAGSGPDRVVAPVRNSRDHRQHWLLRRTLFRAFHDWLWNGADLGTDCRPVWPRAHHDVQHLLFFTLHIAGVIRDWRMEPGGLPVHGRARNWRGGV